MNKEQLRLIAQQIASLNGLHQTLLGKLGSSATEGQSAGSSLTVVDGAIVAHSFGHRIDVAWRPVLNGSAQPFLEYKFLVKWEGEQVEVNVLHLYPDLAFYSPKPGAVGRDLVCRLDNSYLCRQLMEQVASALVGSAVFAPRAA
ncbi:MAG: hypothetical protein ACJ8GJ_16485 [Vitreoscilla sp.]